MTERTLIEALQIGEAACLVACALEPISANWDRWGAAAATIRKERERLESAACGERENGESNG